jgi:hypothetical protein
MAILKNEALIMGRGVVIVTREIGQEFYPLVDDILLLKEGKTMYYGHLHHFQQHILPQLSTQPHLINPITTHLSRHPDLYTPGAPSNRSDKSLQGDERPVLFTANRVYNSFIEERKRQMRDQRDLRVGKEIEREQEGRSGPSPPLSPSRSHSLDVESPSRIRSPTRGPMPREIVFEKRKVEFDRISDMMVQVTFPSPRLLDRLACSSVRPFRRPLTHTPPSPPTSSTLPCRLLSCSHLRSFLPPLPLRLLRAMFLGSWST